MSLDFQQVRQQVKTMGENAPERQRELKDRRELARQSLQDFAQSHSLLREKVELASRQYDPNLRCALPADASLGRKEALDAAFPLPELPAQATILAADGSQINPDRHAEVLFGLVNVGIIQMRLSSLEAPQTIVKSRLLYDEMLFNRGSNILSDESLALQRDLAERQAIVELARTAAPPTISLTDGPLELWGAKDSPDSAEFTDSLNKYLGFLGELSDLSVITAGFVDKPAAGLAVRLLEVALTPDADLSRLKENHPLKRVTDQDLYENLLGPGERSAVFAMQSKSAANYKDRIALHFFYLNVVQAGRPHLARVEIPAWVAADLDKLDRLHAVLISQCRFMGSKSYPYLLHRAHETAVVTMEDKTQVTQMIVAELHRRGVKVGEISNKQANKNLAPRTRFEP